MGEIIKCECEPQFQIYYNKDNNFGIYNCKLLNELEGIMSADENKDYSFILKGIVPEFELYTNYIITCKETLDKRYGLQYNFISFEPQKPKTSEEQMSYLKTLLTDLQVQEIFKIYKYPLDEIINGTFNYNLVKGFGKNNYPPIEKKILDNFVLYDLLSELGKYNITYNQIKKIYEKYKSGEVALQKIKEDPYILYRDIDGIGFKKADQIAQSIGIIKKDDQRRIRACIMYILEDNQNMGNTWIDLKELKEKVFELINNNFVDIEELLDTYEEFYFINNIVALQCTYNTEFFISNELTRLKETRYNNIKFDVDNFIQRQEKIQSFQYTDKQKELFYTVLDNGINILTGAAGCGKCIKGNSYVFTNKGMIKIEDIPEYFSIYENSNCNAEIVSYKLNGEKINIKTSHWYNMGLSKTIKIKTSQGYEIEGTPEHPIVIIDKNGNLQFKQLQYINNNDIIAISINNNIWG